MVRAMTTSGVWRGLAATGGVTITLADLPEGYRGLTAHQRDRAVVFISSSLPPGQRLEALARELSVMERGCAGLEADPVYILPKRQCDIVCSLLVPIPDLGPWVAEWVEVEPITGELVAREWGVPIGVAELSLLSLSWAA
jgi:hypothetical protein